jgi:hypothetical protein
MFDRMVVGPNFVLSDVSLTNPKLAPGRNNMVNFQTFDH